MEVKLFLYIEPVSPVEITKRVRYITDISSDPKFCKINDLKKTLHTEYKFSHSVTGDIEEKLLCGMPIYVNVGTSEVFKVEGSPVLVSQGMFRSNSPKQNESKFFGENRKVQTIVSKRFFKS